MTYIYLNTYKTSNGNEYLYVGSHTWEGEGLDPNYFGSSDVADNYGWFPIKEPEILEVTSKDKRLLIEGEWIRKYCTEFGIADCASRASRSDWYKQFPLHGKMLNLHDNSASQMSFEEIRNRALLHSHKTCKTLKLGYFSDEAHEKADNTNRLNGTGIYGITSEERSEYARIGGLVGGSKGGSTTKHRKRGIFGRTPEQCSADSAKGGKRAKELGVGIHAQSEDERREYASQGGKIGAMVNMENGTGLFGRSEEKRIEDASNAGKASAEANKKRGGGLYNPDIVAKSQIKYKWYDKQTGELMYIGRACDANRRNKNYKEEWRREEF